MRYEVLQRRHPYEAIIRAAEENGCDLIVMGSHGRKGVHALLLGNEAQKVLTHTQIPVLVDRRAPRSPHPPAASALVRPPVEVPRPKT